MAMGQTAATTGQWHGRNVCHRPGEHVLRSGGVSVMAYRWDRDTVYHFVMLTRPEAGLANLRP